MKCSTPESYWLLHEGAIVHARMEHNGVKVDLDYIKSSLQTISSRIGEIEAKLKESDVWDKWRRHYGREANLDSRPQLEKVLYGLVGIPKPDMENLKSGRISTDEKVLSKIDHPFVKTYLSAEKLKKVRSTYLVGVLREVTKDGFVHPSYNLNTARSYRPSCSEPNWQNVPSRNPEMAAIARQCYRSRHPDWCVCEIDFAQIEVRIAATYNFDPVLIRYINDPKTDMHRDTACELFGIKADQVDKKTTRDWAKNRFVFPQFYGSVWFQCAPHLWEAISAEKDTIPGLGICVRQHLRSQGIDGLGVHRKDSRDAPKGTFLERVKQVEDSFWHDRFKVYTDWKNRFWKDYQERGWFEMHTGFVVNNVHKRNDVLNYPIQGAAFHCLLWSLIRIQQILDKRRMKALLVGEIHDCLVADVPYDEVPEFLAICREVMTVELPKTWKWINVPLEVEAEVAPPGGSWYQKKLVAPMVGGDGASLIYDHKGGKDSKGAWAWET